MRIPLSFENIYLRLVDAVFKRWPQRTPSAEKLKRCKIISHRGEHHDGTAMENSLAAFDKAVRAGVWGIELDMRWTRDLIPVVAHDADMGRLYGDQCEIARTTYTALRKRFPSLASLDEVVTRFRNRAHLMIEMKQQAWIDKPRQYEILAETLRPLRPKIDYHLLSLAPQTLIDLTQITPTAKVPIAYYLPDRFSQQAVQHQWGGLCSHYLMMRRSIVTKHQKLGQHIGTGFADSPHALLRELNRGIDWIFSNQAARMQTYIDTCRETAK